MKHLKRIFEKKEEKSDKLEDCPSFKEFNQKIAELKKITKKIHSELKRELTHYVKSVVLLDFVAGVAAGIASVFVNNPIDVVKTRAKGFGMEVYAFDPFVAKATIEADGVKVVDSVEELYSTCNYVSLHIPANDKTKNYTDKSEIINDRSHSLA